MMDRSPVRGLWCATLTPLDRQGRLDRAALTAHVQGLLARGVDGIALFGTSGEGPSFTVAERFAGLDGLLAAGIPPERLLAATGCAALADTVALTRQAVNAGCPRCLVVPPFFWKGLSDEAVFRYYAALIDAVNDDRLRVYLYHIPQVSAVAIHPDTVARLAEAYPGIIAGVKDSGADLAHTQALLKRLPDLSILTGYEPHLPALMKQGCTGTICGVANLWPGSIAALLEPGAHHVDTQPIRHFLDLVHPYGFVPALKSILASQAGDPAWCAVRPPLLPLSETDRASLFGALKQAGIELFEVR